MRLYSAISVASGLSLLACAGCTPDASLSSGGPTFIEMPVSQSGLVGATPQLLDAAFGKPAILRTDGPAQVWLYHDAGCGLNLVLYPDGTGTPRVAMAAPTGDGASPAACSAALARDHVAGQARPVAQNTGGASAPNLDGPGASL